MLNTLQLVKQRDIVEHMKKDTVTLSSKYQLVIPSNVRKKMGLKNTKDIQFRVKSFNSKEIVFTKEPTLDEILGSYTGYFPKDATAAIRKRRDEDWE